MDRDGARWIEELPAGLAAQQGLLRGLLAFSQADPGVRWLVLGCSLARGAGDWLSDIDAAVGVVDEQLPGALPRARSAVDGLGELVESFHHQLPGLALTHERIFAQYADRSQLDLVVYPATVFGGSIPDVVVLYDLEDLLAVPAAAGSAAVGPAAAAPAPVPPEQIREWAFLGWCALADLGKYVRRGSAWEALGRLHEARAQLWQLWAVVRAVPQPQYGLTSVLDFSGAVPAGVEETVCGLGVDRLLAAGLRVAELLEEVGGQLSEQQRAVLPSAMGRFVISDLRAAAGLARGGAGQRLGATGSLEDRCRGRPARSRPRSGSAWPGSTWSDTSTSSRSARLLQQGLPASVAPFIPFCSKASISAEARPGSAKCHSRVVKSNSEARDLFWIRREPLEKRQDPATISEGGDPA